ncbi:hypothetical protein DAPPUDRAFT_248508 [Daphnia pulex]|uniref:Uncharacterized protein n=1 Tax=Daphnia pulex TaxID=6669 RepID=E9GUT1_DAPPU|nr:hypothetical protein DAPPUDRAFT_248508 [Daphnia pulex]|eukprot:EFX76791.1 hypothetical protein DAPPUDRAFT_248508 [Daphnia pulex]
MDSRQGNAENSVQSPVESTASRNLFLSPGVTDGAFKFEPADQAAKATIYYYLETAFHMARSGKSSVLQLNFKLLSIEEAAYSIQ